MSCEKMTFRMVAATSLMLASGIRPAKAAPNARASERMKIIYHYAGHRGILSDEDCFKAVKDIGANTVVRLFYSKKSTESFLRQAQARDVNVMVMVKRWHEPFKKDLAGWSEYMARTALKYPSLVAWTAVDYIGEKQIPGWSTPEAIRSATELKNRINPNVRFLPELYYDAHGFELKYFEEGNPYDAALTDGAQFFLWAGYSRKRRLSLDKLDEYLSTAKRIVPPAHYVSGLYVIKGGQYASADMVKLFYPPELVEKMLTMAMDNSPGICVYALDGPLLAYGDTNSLLRKEKMFGMQTNDDPAFDFKLGARQGTVMGWYHGVSTSARLPDNIESARISFKIRDNRDTHENERYRAKFGHKQVLVNDKVVWEKAIHSDGRDVEAIDQDIAPFLDGTTAKLTIRLFGKVRSDKGDAVYVGNIRLTVNGNPIKTNFKFESGVAHLERWVQTYNVVKEVLSRQR